MVSLLFLVNSCWNLNFRVIGKLFVKLGFRMVGGMFVDIVSLSSRNLSGIRI